MCVCLCVGGCVCLFICVGEGPSKCDDKVSVVCACTLYAVLITVQVR